MGTYIKLALIAIAFVIFGVASWQAIVPLSENKSLKKDIEDLKVKLDQANLDLKTQSDKTSQAMDKIKLLGTLHNENWAAAMNGHAEEASFIGRDWKIGEMPKYLELSNSDREWLMMYVDEKMSKSAVAP
jgi:hypothetical protein